MIAEKKRGTLKKRITEIKDEYQPRELPMHLIKNLIRGKGIGKCTLTVASVPLEWTLFGRLKI